jgi:hypothetical protein
LTAPQKQEIQSHLSLLFAQARIILASIVPKSVDPLNGHVMLQSDEKTSAQVILLPQLVQGMVAAEAHVNVADTASHRGWAVIEARKTQYAFLLFRFNC